MSIFFKASAWLTIVLTILIVLVRAPFATHAGQIAFESHSTGNWEILLLDLQTGVTRNLTRNPADDITPAWSPDGKQIAFISDRDGTTQPQVYLMNADGSDLRRLGSGSGIYNNPVWTTDGHSLVLTHGWQQIFKMDTLNASEEWLGAGFAPHLSPDGKRLLYYNYGTSVVNSHIYTLNLTDRHITDLTVGPSHNWDATWSPNGQEIVFVSMRTGKPTIYMMNADGSDPHSVTASGNDVSAAWSPDGKQIVYASGANGTMQLYIVNIDGSSRHQVTTLSGDQHAPAWRP